MSLLLLLVLISGPVSLLSRAAILHPLFQVAQQRSQQNDPIVENRAGIHLAEVATDSLKSARHLQQILANGAWEALFFPDLADLPEGLRQGRFEERYQDVQSSAYQKLLADIDQRIKQLPLFQPPSK